MSSRFHKNLIFIFFIVLKYNGNQLLSMINYFVHRIKQKNKFEYIYYKTHVKKKIILYKPKNYNRIVVE